MAKIDNIRIPMPERAVEERIRDFAEVPKGYTEEQILRRLVQEYLDFKDNIDETTAIKYSRAILDEGVKIS